MGDRGWEKGLFLSQSRYLKVARKVVFNGGNDGLDECQKDHQVLMQVLPGSRPISEGRRYHAPQESETTIQVDQHV